MVLKPPVRSSPYSRPPMPLKSEPVVSFSMFSRFVGNPGGFILWAQQPCNQGVCYPPSGVPFYFSSLHLFKKIFCDCLQPHNFDNPHALSAAEYVMPFIVIRTDYLSDRVWFVAACVLLAGVFAFPSHPFLFSHGKASVPALASPKSYHVAPPIASSASLQALNAFSIASATVGFSNSIQRHSCRSNFSIFLPFRRDSA